MEPSTGVEPVTRPYQGRVLPLDHEGVEGRLGNAPSPAGWKPAVRLSTPTTRGVSGGIRTHFPGFTGRCLYQLGRGQLVG